MIFCWSAHHTGTWTTLKWLESHQDIQSVIELRFLTTALLEGSYSYMTTQFWSGDRTAVHAHFAYSRAGTEMDPASLALGLSHQTVIPLRDPLAVCLTAQFRTDTRHQGFDGLDAITELGVMAQAIPLLRACSIFEPVVIPWDLAPGPSERVAWLQQFRRKLALEDSKATFHWADRWPIENSKGDYAFKQAYIQRDRAHLKRSLPGVWKALEGIELSFRPFLEEVGYSDLLWWGQ